MDEIINVQNEPCLGASVCNEVAKISVNYNTLNCFINQIKGVMWAIKAKIDMPQQQKRVKVKYLLVMWVGLLRLSNVCERGT